MVYFCYLPNGTLTQAHRFTISRLRDCNVNLLIVYATPDPQSSLDELKQSADALIWKAISGFDFSAYSIALWNIAVRSPTADVFVFNDSTFGPFRDLGRSQWQMPWDLTAFTGSYEEIAHIQSYAFVMRAISVGKMIRMASVFEPVFAFNEINDVIHFQELRFGRVASRQMSVGALWAGSEGGDNLTLTQPFDLIEDGFPFLKKSLLGKHQRFQDAEKIRHQLELNHHPVEPI